MAQPEGLIPHSVFNSDKAIQVQQKAARHHEGLMAFIFFR
ncbi:hypothetical protein F385_2239 [Pantoea agglomerans 299R]|nr:hypothetical protein F385_2239 [Pantoea agglomerans 299R]